MINGKWVLRAAFIVAAGLTIVAANFYESELGSRGEGATVDKGTAGKHVEELRPDRYTKQCNPNKFDGRCYYDAVWQAFDELELNLGDPKRRAEFAKWRHRFDNTGELDCPEAAASNDFACPSADRAAWQMINSIGEEFDYFFDVETTKKVSEQEHSTLEGIGVSVSIKDLQVILAGLPKSTTQKEARAALKVGPGHELLVMEDPNENNPAAGFLRKGDVIVAVKEAGASGDALKVEGLTLDEAVSHLRGKQNTKVEVTIDRAEQGTTVRLTHTLTRAHVDRHVLHVHEIEGKAIVLKIDDFSTDTFPKDFQAALSQIAQSRLPIVVDLRDNPGGTIGFGQMLIRALVGQGVELETIEREFASNVFLRSRILLDQSSVVGLAQRSDTGATSISGGGRAALNIDPARPVGVLINGQSASTSEIVSGALKFSRRAIVYGTPSFGKDAGQQPILFPYGRRAQIPVMVFLPGGEPIQKLVPDREIPISADDIKQGRDPQLDALVEALQQESFNAAAQEAQVKRHEEDRASYRARALCIRDKAAQLPLGVQLTEESAKSCDQPASGGK